MIKKTVILALLIFIPQLLAGAEKEWWQKWDNFPSVPKISAAQTKALMLSGEKIVLIYSGYSVTETVCGSLAIPYTLVPPNANGARVNLSKIPKDWWVLCYCP